MEITEKNEYPFEFSVIMAVYNVEPFLREAVESLVGQDFGFKKIQLVMVDDGSTDGSGAICNEYSERYPENVVVVHKENGGVSSARNEGLKHASGRYLNFMDPDDKLSKNCMSAVKSFFNRNIGKTDVVAIPMKFFGALQGDVILNYKFNKGNRVIELCNEYSMIQLSMSATFIASEALKGREFDTRLKISEDAKLLCQILLEKMTLGVVKTAVYWYRKRIEGQKSAIQGSQSNKSWYLDTPEYFYKGIIDYSREKLGFVPRFIQYTLCYDIQWRILMDDIPQNVLTEEEYAEYRRKIYSLLTYIDDEVILSQKKIYSEHKLFLLGKKYGRAPHLIKRARNAVVSYSPSASQSLANSACRLEMLTRQENGYLLEGFIPAYPCLSDVEVYAEINGEKKLCKKVFRKQPAKALGEDILYYNCFSVLIPCDQETTKVKMLYTAGGAEVYCTNIKLEKYFPVSSQYKNSYCCENGKVIYYKDETLYICDCDRREQMRRERNFCKELWKSNKLGERKAVVARILAHVLRHLKRRPIWIISDRLNKADDNGEAFFRFMRSEHRKDILCYYTILSNSADYGRMKSDGHTTATFSFKHKVLFLICDCNISSQADDYTHTPFKGYDHAYRDLYRNIKQVFLQHGITQNGLADWLNRFNKNLSGFVTAAYPEYRAISDGEYCYTDKEVWLTGFPRFDRLYRDEKNIITVMPTWRQFLVTGDDPVTGSRKTLSGFCESEYYNFYDSLINDARLLDAAEKNGYHISFMPHPALQPHISLFNQNEKVSFCGIETSYRDAYAGSDLVVTDYSSAVFDFAYMRKPIIYCQFDRDMFFSGAHTVKEGYFNYEQDGFGEVEYDLESTVERIIEYMENGCKLKDKYRERIDSFFAFNDTDNCRRVYEKILELNDRKD